MTTKLELRRQINRFMQQPRGNWRFKSLLLAALEGGENVGKVWPTRDNKLHAASKENPRRSMEGNVVIPKYRDGKELAVARSEFSDRELEDEIPRDLYIKRMLLAESETELDTLWREELLDTVIEGAAPRQVARESSTVINVNARRGDIPRGQSQTYADSVAEGAEIPTDEENFDTVAYDCKKFAQGFGLTDELIDLAQPDVIERNVRFAGAAVENAINREWLTNLVDNAGLEHDTAGSNQDATMVNLAIEQVELQDFGPVDTLVMHPEFKTDLFEDTNLAYANRAGSDDVITDRAFNQVLGATLVTASDGTMDPDGTQTWGFNADGEIGAVAYQAEMSAVVIYQDLQTKDFDDPIRDIQGGNVRAWADSVYMQPNAAARIEY